MTRAELIKAIKENPKISIRIGLPANIRQEGASRDLFERVFHVTNPANQLLGRILTIAVGPGNGRG